MEFTIHGAILIPLGLLWFVTSERWLYGATIFFTPFTATALANFSGGFWVTPAQMFGSLWLARCLLKRLVANQTCRPSYRGQTSLWMIVFFATILVSIIMPFIIDGDLFILGTILVDETGPLHFSSRNVTTPIYVLFGLLLSTFIADRNLDHYKLRDTLRLYIISALFVSAWGWIQFACNLAGIDYPALIFNNSQNVVAQGFQEVIAELSEDASRVSSVATEPSVMAQFLISAIPFLFLSVALGQRVFSRHVDRIALASIVGILLVSTSGTAYFGLLVFSIAGMIVLAYLRHLGFAAWIAYVGVFAGCVAVYVNVPYIEEFVTTFIINKLETGSGIERLLTIQYAWDYFLQYPILGVGWGSVTSNDLLVYLLANAGILGLCTFSILAGYIIVRLIGAIRRSRQSHAVRQVMEDETVGIAALMSFLLLLILQVVTGFQYGFSYFWVILGLSIAAQSVLRLNLSRTDAEPKTLRAYPAQ